MIPFVSLLYVILCLFPGLTAVQAALAAYASIVTPLADETLERFVQRHAPPQTTLVHHIVETNPWGGKAPVIIAFYEQVFQQAGQTYRRLLSYLYVPQAPKVYRKVFIDTFEPEGGDPGIEAVFFAPVGRDKQLKLLLLCAWPQVHHDFRGTLYATFVYKAARADTQASQLPLEHELSQQLEGGCECEWADGRRSTAKYKTAKDLQAAIRTLGQ